MTSILTATNTERNGMAIRCIQYGVNLMRARVSAIRNMRLKRTAKSENRHMKKQKKSWNLYHTPTTMKNNRLFCILL